LDVVPVGDKHMHTVMTWSETKSVGRIIGSLHGNKCTGALAMKYKKGTMLIHFYSTLSLKESDEILMFCIVTRFELF
jgi:hypothetical protein